MRPWPLLAALALVASVPSAHAGTSSISLDGPSTVRAERATTVDLRATLLLDGVACTSDAQVPVSLRIAEQTGMRSAQLALEEVTFRLAGHEAATGEWRKEAIVLLTLWTEAASGLVRVTASYALPQQCIALGGATSGQATLTLRVDGSAPQEEPQAPASPPRSESLLTPAPASTARAAEPSAGVSVPVVGAIVGTLIGGAVVLVKRVRAARA